MNATRDKLAALRLVSQKLIERLPVLHRMTAGALLQNFTSIVEDLVDELEQLKGRK